MGDIYGLSGFRNYLFFKECFCNKFDVYLFSKLFLRIDLIIYSLLVNF